MGHQFLITLVFAGLKKKKKHLLFDENLPRLTPWVQKLRPVEPRHLSTPRSWRPGKPRHLLEMALLIKDGLIEIYYMYTTYYIYIYVYILHIYIYVVYYVYIYVVYIYIYIWGFHKYGISKMDGL